MLISKPHLCTKLEIWQPKYHTESGEWEVWPLRRKIAYASPVIIIQFTKAKHLEGQRFCIRRQDVERCPVGTNGRAQVYRVPFNKLEPYETPADVINTANQLFKKEKV